MWLWFTVCCSYIWSRIPRPPESSVAFVTLSQFPFRNMKEWMALVDLACGSVKDLIFGRMDASDLLWQSTDGSTEFYFIQFKSSSLNQLSPFKMQFSFSAAWRAIMRVCAWALYHRDFAGHMTHLLLWFFSIVTLSPSTPAQRVGTAVLLSSHKIFKDDKAVDT